MPGRGRHVQGGWNERHVQGACARQGRAWLRVTLECAGMCERHSRMCGHVRPNPCPSKMDEHKMDEHKMAERSVTPPGGF